MKAILGLILFLITSAVQAAPVINKDRVILVEGPITRNTTGFMRGEIEALEKDTSKPIDMVFNSPGGELLSGYLVVDRMEAARAKGVTIRCFVRGLAASMAFQMLLHCDERYATPHALLLWHPVRLFWMGPLTAADAKLVARHLGSANRTVLDDLRKHIPDLSEKDLLWHYNQESLHQAVALARIAPSFFTYVGSDIGNIYTAGAAPFEEDASNIDQRNLIYIHERFLEN